MAPKAFLHLLNDYDDHDSHRLFLDEADIHNNIIMATKILVDQNMRYYIFELIYGDFLRSMYYF